MSLSFRLDGSLRVALAGFLMFVFATAAGARADGWPMMLPTNASPLTIETQDGTKDFSIEVADDPDERRRGLMFRQSMGNGHGMLFVFPESRRLGFWMKNTPMPLDLLFIAGDGEVRAIEHGAPFSTASISPDVESRFVLELKAGTAQKAEIEVGDSFFHPLIDGRPAE